MANKKPKLLPHGHNLQIFTIVTKPLHSLSQDPGLGQQGQLELDPVHFLIVKQRKD